MPKKGQTFCFSEGSYSDYHLTGHFIAKDDFVMEDVSREYVNGLGTKMVKTGYKYIDGKFTRLAVPVEEERPVIGSADGFQAFLIRKDLIEEADVTEYYTGDYDFEVIKEF